MGKRERKKGLKKKKKAPKSLALDKEFSNTMWHMVSVWARVGGGDSGSMD